MSYVALAALAGIVVVGVLGFREGVVRRLVEVLGAMATIILTARWAADITPAVVEATGWSKGASLLVGWAGMVIAGLLASRLLGVIVSRLIHLTLLGWLDRVGGAVCGATLGLLVASLLVNFIGHVPGGEGIRTQADKDAFGRFVIGAAPNLAAEANDLAGGRFAELWRDVNEEADARLEAAADEAREKADELREKSEQELREATGR